MALGLKDLKFKKIAPLRLESDYNSNENATGTLLRPWESPKTEGPGFTLQAHKAAIEAQSKLEVTVESKSRSNEFSEAPLPERVESNAPWIFKQDTSARPVGLFKMLLHLFFC
ncbi:MAG: hypothetical protein HQK50_18230 [Oligoflexia bacterium]|nr:hypothetical protein [Oligoflexia bacterium]MBF0367518.1 hypothetical protein [Oligoflexia bacterium]